MNAVRDLILRHGWNSTVYQILNPGIEHWFSRDRQAVVGFVRAPGRWIAAGAPVCAAEDLFGAASQFEAAAAERNDSRVCYFCAMDRLRQTLGPSRGHASIAIGAQPVWDPRGWIDRIRRRSSLRAQLNRARNKGVRIALAGPGVAGAGLHRCLEEWLNTRSLPPMHFLVEPDTLDGVLDDRRLYLARREGRVVAFLVASPVPRRQGFLIEQIVRGCSAPNGTAELLIDACMRDLAAQGAAYVTQGLVALSRHARQAIAANPLWIRAIMAWARAHGRRFYNFDGLEHFRAKMEPDGWEMIYAITNEPRFTPATLHAIAEAFCGSPPIVAVARALIRALRQEGRWLLERAAARS